MIYQYQEITPEISMPIISIILKHKDKFIFYDGLIDSGTDHCIFNFELAQILGIKLSKSKVSFKGVGKGNIRGFWGEIEIRILGISYKMKAIFAEISDFGHGILGQKGFFDHFDVKVSYQKQTIEIEPYIISFRKPDIN